MNMSPFCLQQDKLLITFIFLMVLVLQIHGYRAVETYAHFFYFLIRAGVCQPLFVLQPPWPHDAVHQLIERHKYHEAEQAA